MSEDVYRKLARRLDSTPYGFSATESGVELGLLAKLFTPEQAALAAAMRLSLEPCAEIAVRAGVDPDVAGRILDEMARKRLIRARGEGDQRTYGLLAFIPGFYENRMYQMDAEVAVLFEQYYQEAQGGDIAGDVLPIHRVIPVQEAIPGSLAIFPYEQATEWLEQAKAWAVRECACRLQQRLIGKTCDHPVEVCMVFAPVEGVFDRSEVDRPITKGEALEILRQAAEVGLVHSTYNYRGGFHHICNCCTCACMFLRGVAEFGRLNAVARSDFSAVVDVEACVGCGDCVEKCPFGALSMPEELCLVDSLRCMGCGHCVTVCPSGALRLERLPEDEVSLRPIDRQEWTARRFQERGIAVSDIL